MLVLKRLLSTTAPTITDFVLVPGYWLGPGIWRKVAPGLKKAGFGVTTVTLPSTGVPASADASSPGPCMFDDITAVRLAVSRLVEHQHRTVVVVGHSAGAFLAAHALRHLGAPSRTAHDKPGGVAKLAFVAGAMFHQHAPFMDVQGDKLYCRAPRTTLFNDVVDDDEAAAEVARLTFQPGFGWHRIVEYVAWTELPSAYLVCSHDMAIPSAVQRAMAHGARCEPLKEVDAGHCAPVTRPAAVVDFLLGVAKSVR